MTTNNQLDIHQIHRINMLRSLNHRLEVARQRGNTQLIEQLEAEKNYYGYGDTVLH